MIEKSLTEYRFVLASTAFEALREFNRGVFDACIRLLAPGFAPALERHLRVLREVSGLHEPSATVQAQLALSDELTERVSELLRRSTIAPDAAMRSIERTAKHKAFRAFVGRGGTLASFERAWPAMFVDAWRNKEWRAYTFV